MEKLGGTLIVSPEGFFVRGKEGPLEEGETECRWCFAVDLVRVKGEEIITHFYADAFLMHLKCPRYGGEFTLYSAGWGEDYLKERIFKLHPELEDRIDDGSLNEINDRIIYHGDC